MRKRKKRKKRKKTRKRTGKRRTVGCSFVSPWDDAKTMHHRGQAAPRIPYPK